MKRVKVKKDSNERKMRKRYTAEAVDFVMILIEAAVLDVFDATDKQVNKLKDTVNRYAQYVVDGVVSLEDFKKRNAKGNPEEVEHETTTERDENS